MSDHREKRRAGDGAAAAAGDDRTAAAAGGRRGALSVAATPASSRARRVDEDRVRVMPRHRGCEQRSEPRTREQRARVHVRVRRRLGGGGGGWRRGRPAGQERDEARDRSRAGVVRFRDDDHEAASRVGNARSRRGRRRGARARAPVQTSAGLTTCAPPALGSTHSRQPSGLTSRYIFTPRTSAMPMNAAGAPGASVAAEREPVLQGAADEHEHAPSRATAAATRRRRAVDKTASAAVASRATTTSRRTAARASSGVGRRGGARRRQSQAQTTGPLFAFTHVVGLPSCKYQRWSDMLVVAVRRPLLSPRRLGRVATPSPRRDVVRPSRVPRRGSSSAPPSPLVVPVGGSAGPRRAPASGRPRTPTPRASSRCASEVSSAEACEQFARAGVDGCVIVQPINLAFDRLVSPSSRSTPAGSSGAASRITRRAAAAWTSSGGYGLGVPRRAVPGPGLWPGAK